MLKACCDLEIQGRKHIIKDVYYAEQQECHQFGITTHGVYKMAFELLFSDWWNTRNEKDYFASTEEIAIQMGLLRLSYLDLEQVFKDDKMSYAIKYHRDVNGDIDVYNLNLIHRLDWEKRIEDTIIDKLQRLSIDKRNNRNYNVSTTFVRKQYHNKMIDGINTRVIEYKGELSNDELSEIYKKFSELSGEKIDKDACATEKYMNLSRFRTYYKELRDKNIYPSWKIIATPGNTFKPLPEDFKEFLGRILIENKQNKVHRSLTTRKGKFLWHIDDDNEVGTLDIREDLYIVENILNGSSLYKEIHNEDGTVDYIRLVNGRQIEQTRHEVDNPPPDLSKSTSF